MQEFIIGNRIRELRKSKHLSQEALGELVNASRVAISNWEGDKNLPTRENAQKLGSIFGVSEDYILGNTDDPRPLVLPIGGDGSTDEQRFLQQLASVCPSLPQILKEELSSSDLDMLKSALTSIAEKHKLQREIDSLRNVSDILSGSGAGTVTPAPKSNVS